MPFNLAGNHKIQLQSEALKQRFIECMQVEQAVFAEFADKFHAQAHPSDQSCSDFCEMVIATIDKILASGNWDDSLFLHNTIKPLKKLREQALQLLDLIAGNNNLTAYQLPLVPEDSVKLYISIFQNDGHNLRKWELQLKSINSHLMGRAVYQQEEDVQSSIRNRLAQASEAYIVVIVKKNLVQNDSHIQRKDRNGRVLVTLKSNAVVTENILEFVHLNKRYYFINGKLGEQ